MNKYLVSLLYLTLNTCIIPKSVIYGLNTTLKRQKKDLCKINST